MKKTLLKHLTVTGYMEGIDLTDCELSAKKLKDARYNMKDAKKNVKNAKRELDEALKDSIKKIKTEKELEQKSGNNRKNITDFKSGFANEKKELLAKYQKMVNKLERKEIDLKMKLNAYKAKGQDKWDSFKRELNHDLDGMEKTLKDLTADNKKKVKKLVL